MLRRAKKSSDRGVNSVEFALVLTIILGPLLFGIMDMTRALYAYHFVSNAAREACRYAQVRGATFSAKGACATTTAYTCDATAANITSYVQSIVPLGIQVSSTSTPAACPAAAPTSAGTLSVCTSWPGTAITGTSGACSSNSPGNNPGCPVEIQVQYLYKFTLPFISTELGSIDLQSTSQMVMQQ
jgi:Flp pilus assembly protein TadG